MITNERQYRITKAQIEKFKAAIGDFDSKVATERTKSKILAEAELAALNSEYEVLSLQLHEYETLKSGTIERLKASTLEELPTILIRARIAKGLSQRQLAEAMGLREQQIQRYEAEKYASANLQRLAEVANTLSLNISEVAEFRSDSQKSLDAGEIDLAWDQFPIKDMYRRNWFEGFSGSLSNAVDNAEELVKKYVTSSIDAPIQAMARQRVRLGGTVNRYALLAWQCRIINLAKKEGKKVGTKYKQKAITNEWLNGLAHISIEKDGPQKAVNYLQNSGIRLVVEPHLPQTHLDGAAFLLADGPVIGLTIRYDRIDNFWFVLFHELIHVKKHLNKGSIESIFDNLDDTKANDIEKEADECAGEALVPENQWETALARYVRSKESIEDFASELGIHPAVVAGKIRREADNYMILTDMVGQGEIRKLFPCIDFSY
ncbi:MAG TPA: XRE family transcriptional regulator [Sedimentisphaerales bacterium]|nr:XRE family transcriptional regulator [Sedimentisphaerales bacterium]